MFQSERSEQQRHDHFERLRGPSKLIRNARTQLGGATKRGGKFVMAGKTSARTMKRSGAAALAIAIALGAGCSSDESVSTQGTKGAACLPNGGCDIGLTCKDGKCQATGSGGASDSGATGAGGSSGSGGSTGGSAGSGGGSGSGGSTGGGVGTGGSAGTSTTTCLGSHPLLDGGARFCGVGDCYCDTDRCYAQSEAASCCTGNLTCFGPDGGVACTGSHPLVDGSARFCSAGDCYCSARDTCFASAIAATCCDVTPSCT